MSDVKLFWDMSTGYGDWIVDSGDIVSGDGFVDLQTAVFISIFTDRVADPDFILTDGTNDRRKWWGEDYYQSTFGSRLWELYRAKVGNKSNVLLMAKNFVLDSLNWLIQDGIAKAISVNTFWQSRDTMGMVVTITEPTTQAKRSFNFSQYWGASAPGIIVQPGLSSLLDAFILDQSRLV